MKAPTQAEFRDVWREALIKNGLAPSLVDDPLFRKTLVTTSQMGQAGICMGKGAALGKKDTTLPNRDEFTQTITGREHQTKSAQGLHAQVERVSCPHSLHSFCTDNFVGDIWMRGSRRTCGH